MRNLEDERKDGMFSDGVLLAGHAIYNLNDRLFAVIV
jgi:hypothetical protein